MNTTTQEILDRLHEIEGEQPGQNSAEVWAYIQTLDEWDEEQTQAVDPSGAGDRFVLTDGTVIRWSNETMDWRRSY